MTQPDKPYMPLSVSPTFVPITIANSATTVHIGASTPPRIDVVNVMVNNSGSTTLDATVQLGAANPTLVVEVPPKTTKALLENVPVELGKALIITGSATGLRAYGHKTETSNIF